MDRDGLFPLGADEGVAGAETSRPPRIGPKRLRHAVRDQVEFQQCSLDQLLPEDHEARIVWEYVCGLDLSQLRQQIQAVEGGPGQAPADPRILVAVWLYATLRGVGSARELNRLCQYHAAYRWLCGGVSMNYHTLADFRTQHVDLLDRLLTESAASLMTEGLVTLDRVAQDGMKVRAMPGPLRSAANRPWRRRWPRPKTRWRNCGRSWRPIRGPVRPANKRPVSVPPRNERSGFAPRWSSCRRSRRARRPKIAPRPVPRRRMPRPA